MTNSKPRDKGLKLNLKHGILQDGYYKKREKESQKLRIGGGSWTINLDELRVWETKVKFFQLITESFTYTISHKEAFFFGFVRLLGGEQKLIVPIKYWTAEARKVADK